MNILNLFRKEKDFYKIVDKDETFTITFEQPLSEKQLVKLFTDFSKCTIRKWDGKNWIEVKNNDETE